MAPTGAAPNGNITYLYLPKGHGNIAKYDDLSYNFRL